MGEKTYRVENVFTGDKINVPEGLIGTYRDATEPTTGKRLYRFTEDVHGYMKLDDGTIKKEVIPADSVHQTSVTGSPFLLPQPGMGKKAKHDERYRRLKKRRQSHLRRSGCCVSETGDVRFVHSWRTFDISLNL